jgi:hypothetical protein
MVADLALRCTCIPFTPLHGIAPRFRISYLCLRWQSNFVYGNNPLQAESCDYSSHVLFSM